MRFPSNVPAAATCNRPYTAYFARAQRCRTTAEVHCPPTLIAIGPKGITVVNK